LPKKFVKQQPRISTNGSRRSYSQQEQYYTPTMDRMQNGGGGGGGGGSLPRQPNSSYFARGNRGMNRNYGRYNNVNRNGGYVMRTNFNDNYYDQYNYSGNGNSNRQPPPYGFNIVPNNGPYNPRWNNYQRSPILFYPNEMMYDDGQHRMYPRRGFRVVGRRPIWLSRGHGITITPRSRAVNLSTRGAQQRGARGGGRKGKTDRQKSTTTSESGGRKSKSDKQKLSTTASESSDQTPSKKDDDKNEDVKKDDDKKDDDKKDNDKKDDDKVKE